MMKLCAQLYSVREAAQTPEGGNAFDRMLISSINTAKSKADK